MSSAPSRPGPAVSVPKDAVIVELRPDVLTFETRDCLLPGTIVTMRLLMEGNALPMQLPTAECLVVDKDRRGFLYHARIPLSGLPGPDQDLIRLFIAKGRGAPQLVP